jgi:hypothetical protein
MIKRSHGKSLNNSSKPSLNIASGVQRQRSLLRQRKQALQGFFGSHQFERRSAPDFDRFVAEGDLSRG